MADQPSPTAAEVGQSWTIHEMGSSLLICEDDGDGGRRTVAEVYIYDQTADLDRRNAALIAAAPGLARQNAQMLEALKAVIERFDPGDTHQYLCAEADCWLEMSRAAVDAAEKEIAS